MFQRAITFSATLLLVGAAVFMTAGPVQAQRGGHGGGGHGGAGFHAGGGHGGVHAGGYHGGGYYHGGYGRGYGYRHNYGYGRYYGGYYPYYGYYPNYGSYPYYGGSYSLENAYADDTPLLSDGLTTDSGYRGLTAQQYQAFAQAAANNTSAPAPVDTTAYVTVRVPAKAEIWFYGTKTNSAGAVRRFQTPPLTPGGRYNYEIQARWSENGHEVTESQQVEVAAGDHLNVTFPVRPNAAQ
jgi:uncharacterized protein (TIGR03000 family)